MPLEDPWQGSPRFFIGDHVCCVLAGAESICVHYASYPSEDLTPDSVRTLIDASNPYRHLLSFIPSSFELYLGSGLLSLVT